MSNQVLHTSAARVPRGFTLDTVSHRWGLVSTAQDVFSCEIVCSKYYALQFVLLLQTTNLGDSTWLTVNTDACATSYYNLSDEASVFLY